MAHLLAYPMEFYEDDALLKVAYELAKALNRSRTYDVQHLTLAQRLSCEFWTADERMFNAIQSEFPSIHWLGYWQADAMIIACNTVV